MRRIQRASLGVAVLQKREFPCKYVREIDDVSKFSTAKELAKRWIRGDPPPSTTRLDSMMRGNLFWSYQSKAFEIPFFDKQ
jgi:hypothetical protein